MAAKKVHERPQGFNPYSPPGGHEIVPRWTELPPLPERRWNEIKVQVVSAERQPYERLITVAGSISAEILYDPRGAGERVFVNGQLAARSSPFYWTVVAPQIDFCLEWLGHSVPASIEVSASYFSWPPLRISKYRLSIAGKVVYEDPEERDPGSG